MKRRFFSLLLAAVMMTTASTFATTTTLTETSLNTTTTYASTNWDSILNDLEKYVDSYIKCMKKAKEGDMTAMSEMATLLESTNSLTKKLDSADDDLTAEQAARYIKIMTKMSKAATDLL